MEERKTLKIQIFIDDGWRNIGEVRLLDTPSLGVSAKSEFSYDIDYAIQHAERSDWRAVSVMLPVTTVPQELDQWPPFLLDLFPQGAALKYVVDHYRISDRPENYWKIIQTARLNPPGNLRVFTEGMERTSQKHDHPGFAKRDVIAKGPDFLEYMIKMGAPAAGTTGASGAAPKFLLREDRKGRFHADGALPDCETSACWLIKFRRGMTEMDSDILKTEQTYYEVARNMGLRVFGQLHWEKNCLFIPRFDRTIAKSKIIYLGMESFYSMIGCSEFGSRLRHETYLSGLNKFSNNRESDLIEYCLRDFLNQMLGNTDNHGRNQSLLKLDSLVTLSPLYDFAPMKFDPEGIVRNTRWDDPIENGDIGKLTELLTAEYKVEKKNWDLALKEFINRSQKIEHWLTSSNVPVKFISGTAENRKLMIGHLTKYCEKYL